MADVIPFPFHENLACKIREAIEFVEAFAKMKDVTICFGLIQMVKQMAGPDESLPHPAPAGDLHSERIPPEQRRRNRSEDAHRIPLAQV